MFCLVKPRKHYIVLLSYRTLIIVARYGTIVEPGTPRNWRELKNVHALRFVYKDKKSSYDRLLNWIGLHSTLEGRRIQDMLITINSCFQEKAANPIVDLLKVKLTKYTLRGTNMLSLPEVRSTKHGLRFFRYFAAKTWNALPDSIRAMAGTREFLSIRHVAF